MLIFFQNCVSPHQMPYIEALSQKEEVEHIWVIAPRLAYNERAAMGWPTSWTTSTDNLTILIAPTDDEVKNILSEVCHGQRHSQCLFSGITAFPEVKHWLDLSLEYDVKRGIITEMPYIYDKPLWMHKIKFALKDWRYVKYFDYVFAIGEDCEKYYRGWSKRWTVAPFMYCTEWTSLLGESQYASNVLNVCFVGSVDKRKNLQELLKAVGIVKEGLIKLTVVGDGPERTNAEESANHFNSRNRIVFVGAKSMSEAQQIIAENDVLVLPSLHDGWGAVVNEALSLGTIAVCSERCGAKSLIKESGFGGIYNAGEPKELAKILTDLAMNIKDLRSQRNVRIHWAKQNISPQAVAERFLSVIDH